MKESINLLPQTPKGGTPLFQVPDKTHPLIIGAIIILEVVFLILLILRGSLDRDRTFLKNSLEQKRSLLAQTSDVEGAIRELQNKLTIIKEFRQDRLSFLEAIKYVPTLIPQDVILVNISLRRDLLQIVAKTSSGISFAKMVENVTRSAKFSDLTLTGSILDDINKLYTFNIEARVEEGIFK